MPRHPPVRALALGSSVAALACGSGGTAPAPPPRPAAPAAPWSAAPLPATRVPEVYLREWAGAENRGACAPLAPVSVEEAATARAARFGGGWAVAYDLPGLRSAFGIAGTGVDAEAPSYDAWPHRMAWADGSTAGYGPEGGSGPNQLAYLRVAGQGCLYNVWSRVGREHLEGLLSKLRFLEVPEPPGGDGAAPGVSENSPRRQENTDMPGGEIRRHRLGPAAARPRRGLSLEGRGRPGGRQAPPAIRTRAPPPPSARG